MSQPPTQTVISDPRGRNTELRRDEILDTLRVQNQARIRTDSGVARLLLMGNHFVITPTSVRFYLEIRDLGLGCYEVRLADRTVTQTLMVD